MDQDRTAPPVAPTAPDPTDPAAGDLISHIYDVAIDPERIFALVAFWAEQIEKGGYGTDGAANEKAGRNGDAKTVPNDISPHLDRTEELLKSALRGHRTPHDSLNTWVHQKRHAALAVTRNGQIVAANAAAITAFGMREGGSVLDFAVAGASTLAGLIATLDATPKVTQLRGQSQDQVYAAVLKYPVVPGSDCVGVTADFVEWPPTLTGLLQSTYRLTLAEIDVLQDLVRGQSPIDVADTTDRSIATVRSHIRALTNKTGTRTQIELVRLCLGLMSIAGDAPARPANASNATKNGNGWQRENQFRLLKLPDGRDRAYIETGDPNGRPLLLFPSPLGLFRFPRAVETGFEHDNLRVLTPLRASLGPSSLPPAGVPVIDSFATDCVALMDALGIKRAPVVCIGMDLLLGVTLANLAPDRISAVIGAGPVLPVTEEEHLARLEPTARFIFTNTRSAPRITNLMTLAFLYMGHLAGAARPLRSFLKSSPLDLALLECAEVKDAMTLGSPYNRSPNFAVHEACSREVEAFVADWRDALVQCKSPVVLLAGDSSPWCPLATLDDFAARSPNIKPIVLPDTGLMVAHHRPDVVFDEVKRWL